VRGWYGRARFRRVDELSRRTGRVAKCSCGTTGCVCGRITSTGTVSDPFDETRVGLDQYVRCRCSGESTRGLRGWWVVWCTADLRSKSIPGGVLVSAIGNISSSFFRRPTRLLVASAAGPASVPGDRAGRQQDVGRRVRLCEGDVPFGMVGRPSRSPQPEVRDRPGRLTSTKSMRKNRSSGHGAGRRDIASTG